MTEEKGKPETKEDCCSDKSGKGCGCGSAGCGCGSGGCGSRGGCKCFKAFLLVLLGFLAGYFMTRKCSTPAMKCCMSDQMQMGHKMGNMQCPVAGDASKTTPPAK